MGSIERIGFFITKLSKFDISTIRTKYFCSKGTESKMS